MTNQELVNLFRFSWRIYINSCVFVFCITVVSLLREGRVEDSTWIDTVLGVIFWTCIGGYAVGFLFTLCRYILRKVFEESR